MASERGSALVYVFIGVALFGTLIFAFSKSGNQNTSTLTAQQARVIAMQALDFSNNVAKSVDKLIQSGCSESELSFMYPGMPAHWDNPLKRPDGSCNVFKSDGKYISPLQMGVQTEWTSFGMGLNWHFSNYIMEVVGVGPDTYLDLTVQAFPRREVCIQINNLLGIDNPGGEPPRVTMDWGGVSFDGNVLRTSPGRQINPSGHQLYGKDTACYIAAYSDGIDYYHFYKTLVPH